MGRRAKSSKANADAQRPLAGKTPTDDGAKVRDLEQRLAEALKRETEAFYVVETLFGKTVADETAHYIEYRRDGGPALKLR